jgi:hypothetical protein
MENNVSYSSRLVHAIVDQLLGLLPEEPAAAKRLSDIIDPDAGLPNSERPHGATSLTELFVPASAARTTSAAPARKKLAVS